jgi:hypothetical protein
MKQPIYLLILLLFGCNTTPKSDDPQETLKSDSAEIVELPTELLEQEPEPKKELYLNGIYEYDYPNDTKDMNENQFIAFQKNGDDIEGWYYGTSDEFDEAREGYLPGYFVSRIDNLTTKGDSLFFNVSTGFSQCYSTRFPIGLMDTIKLNQEFEKWFALGNNPTINYSGKLDGLKLYIEMFGETRTYRKTKNYFHSGIDNYDPTKCQSEPLLALHENLNQLDEPIVLEFLKTFSVICEANVEFGEWSNELLFKALSRNPAIVITVLSNNTSQLDTTSIFKELESPLHDLIPIDSIITKIQSLSIETRMKNSVLKKLEGLK